MTILLCWIESWHYGQEIGNINTSYYQTAMCPQQGGEFTNMNQTHFSPISDITTWINCAKQCKDQINCNHWQWMKNENKCFIVTSFDGSHRSDNVFSGHRTCPLESNNLFGLCPTKGDNSQMWRKTNSEFYDSSIGIGNM